jgi:transposase
MSSIAFVGMDVHQDFIVMAGVGTASDHQLFKFNLPNDHTALRRQVNRLTRRYRLRCCYEASSCGYVVYRWLQEMGVDCEVIAPSLIPQKPGDRIKTDARDAWKLALMYRAGILATVHVPNEIEQRARSLVRCREVMLGEVNRSRQYILKFLQLRGIIYRDGKNWTQKHWRFLRRLSFEGVDETVYRQYLELLEYKLAQFNQLDTEIERLSQSEPYREKVGLLRCFRGIDTTTAMVILTEIVDFSRFAKPGMLMSYVGLVPSQHSSGTVVRTGTITKAGSRRCRRILIEAAWQYRHKPAVYKNLKDRQQGQPTQAIARSWKAQQRLYKKYWGIANRKSTSKAAVAVARELVGFIWSIMQSN